jgi:hypothetical protein
VNTWRSADSFDEDKRDRLALPTLLDREM